MPSHHTAEVTHRDGTVERYERRDDGNVNSNFHHVVTNGGRTGGMRVQATSSHSIYNHATPGWDSKDENSEMKTRKVKTRMKIYMVDLTRCIKNDELLKSKR
jgi:hypothetical protein